MLLTRWERRLVLWLGLALLLLDSVAEFELPEVAGSCLFPEVAYAANWVDSRRCGLAFTSSVLVPCVGRLGQSALVCGGLGLDACGCLIWGAAAGAMRRVHRGRGAFVCWCYDVGAAAGSSWRSGADSFGLTTEVSDSLRGLLAVYWDVTFHLSKGASCMWK